jgi:hypothetical protein
MPAHKIGRLWKFQASEVDSWVRGGGTAWNPHRPGRLTTAAERSHRADG